MTLASDLRINIKKLDWLPIIVISLIIVLIFPQMVRFYNDNFSMIGAEPYYHARLAENIAMSDELNIFKLSSEELDLAYLKRPFAFNPYHVLLAGSSYFVDLELTSQLVPPMLGALTSVFFFLLLASFGFSRVERYVMLIFVIFNPVFIYTFTISNPHALALFLTVLACYLIVQNRKESMVLTVVALALLAMFSIFNTLLVVALLSAFLIHRKITKERFLLGLLILIGVSVFYPNRFYYEYIPQQASVVAGFISDLGGTLGFGVFTIILATAGIATYWKKKKHFLAFAVAPLSIVPMLWIYGSSPVIYLSFFVTTLAGLGFLRLVEMRWKLQLVQSLTLLIIICGILFSTVSYMGRVIEEAPDATIESSLRQLQMRGGEGLVLTHPHYGYWIEYMADLPVLTDAFSTSGYSQDFLYKTTNSIFYSRNLEDTKNLLGRFSIRYIWINEEMKNGLVWDREDHGLLFLLSDSETFKNRYRKDGIEIWEVIPSET